MTLHLSSRDADFEQKFTSLLEMKHKEEPDVNHAVLEIIESVRTRGDSVLQELALHFDHYDIAKQGLVFTPEEIDTEIRKISIEDRKALEQAALRIHDYHARQRPKNMRWNDQNGAVLGWRWTAISSAGLYVPGGTASYPSSVLMNAVPARIAGVERLAICCPTPKGEINPMVLLAAQLCDIDTIYRIGGAQAIAALAYGTESISAVDKITGPGNAYVAAAKKHVFGRVGIDMIAGPSEILIIADKDNNPDWIALDLLSQAEHDENAQPILITTDENLGSAVIEAVGKKLPSLSRQRIARKSWQKNGVVIIVETLEQAASLSNRIAPEHLELMVKDPEALSKKIEHAGAIFMGKWTPEALGDYISGPNHVLPTARSARFSSGLSVIDFMKRTTISQMTPATVADIGPSAERLALSEGLEAHCLSVGLRLNVFEH